MSPPLALSTAARISIVTPSFNQAAFIDDALKSVKNQGCSALEHIVVDGASTDGTVEILDRCSSQPGWVHLRWVSEPDRGQSDALNKGFRLATGDIIGWLNSDDRYRPGCFEAVVAAFSEYPQADIIYGDYTCIDEKGKLKQIRREISFNQFILLYHQSLYIPSTATFFRRRIFEEGNFIDVDLQYSMDYEFFLRLARRGYRFKHISGLLADFRWHSQSKSIASTDGQVRELDQIVRSNSQLLARLPTDGLRTLALHCLRAVAAGLRYSEKLIKGYYFEPFSPLCQHATERPEN